MKSNDDQELILDENMAEALAHNIESITLKIGEIGNFSVDGIKDVDMTINYKDPA